VAWIAPLSARALAGATGVPLGLITILMLYVLVMRRIMRDQGSTISAAEIAQA
jgi:hypothetical protein